MSESLNPRILISNAFTYDELRSLCFDLKVDFENLPGNTKDAKVREILSYAIRYKKLSLLIESLKLLNPNMDWDSVDWTAARFLVTVDTKEQTYRNRPLQVPPRVPAFTNRKLELEQILTKLAPGEVITLCGPAGIGKSALATEVVWRLVESGSLSKIFPDGVIFYDFNEQPDAKYALWHIALSYGESTAPSVHSAARRALNNRQALLVLDGVELTDNLQMVLRARGACGVLITSRSKKDSLILRLDIKRLNDDHSFALLSAWAGKKITDSKQAQLLSSTLEGWPLLIELIGKHLNHYDEELESYLLPVLNNPSELLNLQTPQNITLRAFLKNAVGQLNENEQKVLAAIGHLSNASFTKEPVLACFGLSVTRTSKASNKSGRWESKLLSFFSGLTLMQTDKAANVLSMNTLDVENSIKELTAFGFLSEDNGKYRVSHQLIYSYIQDNLEIPYENIHSMALFYYKKFQSKDITDFKSPSSIEESRHYSALLSRILQKKDSRFWKRQFEIIKKVDNEIHLLSSVDPVIKTTR